MDELTGTAQRKRLTEVVICQNDDDVELAQDPFAENDLTFPIKEEYVEPTYDEFDYNQVQLVQMYIKPDINIEPHHDEPNLDPAYDDDRDYDDFGQSNDFGGGDYDSDDDFTPLTSNQESKLKNLPETLVPQLKCEVKIDNDDEIKSDIDKNADVPKVEKDEKPKRKCVKLRNKINENKAKAEVKDKKPKGKSTNVKSTLSSDPETSDAKRKNGRPKSQEPHQCTVCGKQYEYASLLKVHTRTHLIDKGHNCPVCKKSFARLDHYKQHINNVHKGEVVDGIERKPSFERKCDICEKIFYHSGNLRKHQLLPSGQRPFSCNECG